MEYKLGGSDEVFKDHEKADMNYRKEDKKRVLDILIPCIKIVCSVILIVVMIKRIREEKNA